MPYTQPVERLILSPDPRLDRKVLIAVEVFDPIAQSLVSRGVRIEARGLDGDPIVSWSGRFVWLQQGDRWPSEISVIPVQLPFKPQVLPTPRPPTFPAVTPAERRIRVVLEPTSAYPFDGVTAIRGRLTERPEPGSPPMSGVRIQLAWFDANSNTWVPAPPAAAAAPDPATDADGQFGVFLRLMPVNPAQPDLEQGFLKVRLQFTASAPTESRATPDNYPFQPPERAPGGRVPEGRLLQADLRLGWSDLLPI